MYSYYYYNTGGNNDHDTDNDNAWSNNHRWNNDNSRTDNHIGHDYSKYGNNIHEFIEIFYCQFSTLQCSYAWLYVSIAAYELAQNSAKIVFIPFLQCTAHCTGSEHLIFALFSYYYNTRNYNDYSTNYNTDNDNAWRNDNSWTNNNSGTYDYIVNDNNSRYVIAMKCGDAIFQHLFLSRLSNKEFSTSKSQQKNRYK